MEDSRSDRRDDLVSTKGEVSVKVPSDGCYQGVSPRCLPVDPFRAF